MPATFLQARTGDGEIVFYSPQAVDCITRDEGETMLLLRSGQYLWTPVALPDLLAILNGQEVR